MAVINEELIKAACKRIADNPQAWDQNEWGSGTGCGATFCFAGHILMASGRYQFLDKFYRVGHEHPLHADDVPLAAARLAGLSPRQRVRLFYDPGDDGPAAYLRLVEEVTGIKVDG